uniref:Putative B-(1-6) glucan synthase n=1 Tax=Moniliophthora roreri TaxID=221103 RepID=A0A0W0F7G8_MONRR
MRRPSISLIVCLGVLLAKLVAGDVCKPPRVSVDIEANNATDIVDNAAAASCFPALGFQMPSSVPSSLNNWWCPYNQEYAFMGFSYEVSQCQSLSKLRTEFKDIRNTFSGRYVRLYGACDRSGFYDDVVTAAWEAGIGVHALVWFGFDGTDQWIGRRDTLIKTLHNNPKAKFVTRVVQFGSEPLYDWVLDPDQLAAEVRSMKSELADLQIPVTISEMAYGYQASLSR